MRLRQVVILSLLLFAGIIISAPAAQAQGYSLISGGRGLLSESPITQHFELEHVRPEVHKWYLPRHLPQQYEQPWYIPDTNYTRDLYRSYVNAELEGEQWYDTFGNPVERGWLLYEWSQEQESLRGSSVFKSGQFSRLFQQLVIASDGDRHGDYRLMVGNNIYTVFTPLTFNKPHFSGLRLDYAADRAQASLIFSRPSMPNAQITQGRIAPSNRTDFTNLMGGHGQFQLGDLATLGLTYINAHHGHTKQEFTDGSPFRGSLTTDQNQSLETIWVRLRDDSPEDERGGALLLDYDIVLVDTSGRELRGREINFLPAVEGRVLGSSLAADGPESILLMYDLSEFSYEDIETADLRQVSIELSVANDYRIDVTSDRQTDGEVRRAQPVFLTAYRAAGNVQDNSNATVLSLDYGLPTANELIGINWNLVDWHGFSLQGETAFNRRHRHFPNPNIKKLHHTVDRAQATYVQAAYNRNPWSLFAEAFSIDENYSTSAWLTDANGKIIYNDVTFSIYELVDDDDDFNAVPEWERRFQPDSGNGRAWPGFDENLDFLHDYNQNANFLPDFEEPFLRFRSDRPEFLPGLDMNYNGTIDRFENDDQPDYPYKRDHRGINLYGTAHVTPGLNFTLGHQNMHLISGDGHTRSAYSLLRWVRSLPAGGRLRLFDHTARVQDDIPDPLRLWIQPLGATGRMRDVADLLPARDTWMHALYSDIQHRLGPDIRLHHRLRWENSWQLDDDEILRQREARQHSGFLGLIDKVEWSLPIGLAVFEPRWKSEYRKSRPFSRRLPTAESLEETLFLLWTQPLMAEQTTVGYFPRYGRQLFSTELQVGLELSSFRLLEGSYEEIDEDFSSWTWVTQLINRTAYQGYQLVTRTGLQIGRRRFKSRRTEQRNMFFLTINAGLQ